MWCTGVVMGHCEGLDPVWVHRAKMEEKDFVDKMRVCDMVPRSDAAKKGCRQVGHGEQGVGRQTSEYAQGGSHRSFVAREEGRETNTSIAQKRPI